MGGLLQWWITLHGVHASFALLFPLPPPPPPHPHPTPTQKEENKTKEEKLTLLWALRV
jgi:hypothetical protein